MVSARFTQAPDDGTAYTTCYDAIMAEVHKVNPALPGVGPEIFGASGLATECKSSSLVSVLSRLFL